MSQDDFKKHKAAQRESWSHFYKLEQVTIAPAAMLVDFAAIQPQDLVLDVACGTGVVSLSAAARKARVCGIDLSAVLVERAIENAKIAEYEIEFREADVEALPYPDNTFDVVLSQFGHMFAPRQDLALNEMLRVLKPQGRIAFSTWPPELFVGSFFQMMARYSPKSSLEIPSPTLWGEPKYILERFGARVTDVHFDRRINQPSFLSVKHARAQFETTLLMFFENINKTGPQQLAAFRQEYEKLIGNYMRGNQLDQHFLMTKATKV